MTKSDAFAGCLSVLTIRFKIWRAAIVFVQGREVFRHGEFRKYWPFGDTNHQISWVRYDEFFLSIVYPKNWTGD
jgi:hypothetical protein